MSYLQDIVPLAELGFVQDIVPFRSSLDSGELVVAVMDDLAVDRDDDELLGADFDDDGDVLVGLVLAHEDPFAEEVDLAVRSDVAHNLDLSSRG